MFGQGSNDGPERLGELQTQTRQQEGGSMNPTLAALEDAITHQAREAAIADVNALFRRLEQDLYHLGIDLRRDEIRTKLKTDLDPLQRKILEAVTKEKACLLAERILRANAI